MKPSKNLWITKLAGDHPPMSKDSPLPLQGFRFAIKDNIDLAGVPTTAGCPAFAYTQGVLVSAGQHLVTLQQEASA